MGLNVYCTNGHFVAKCTNTPSTDDPVARWIGPSGDRLHSETQPAFCLECGAETTWSCRHCESPIEDGASYCGTCGKPLPWTEHALAAANEYADEIADLSDEDRATLKGTFLDLTKNTARTPLAASRFMRIIEKVKPAAFETLKGILVEITSETASKIIMGS